MDEIADILKKVKSLEIKSKRLAQNIFSGDYHSAFKGRGMLFKEVREYAPGDDIRFIDWNVSARFGHPYSKLFEEERELTIMLLVDISSSMWIGSGTQSKKSVAIELAALIAFSANINNDKVGLILFSNTVEKFIPPKKGKQHILYLIREMLYYSSKSNTTALNHTLKFLNNVIKKPSIGFIISDFNDSNFKDALKIANKKHDLIGIQVTDTIETQLPKIGLVPFTDIETRQTQWVDTNSKYIQSKYEEQYLAQTEYCLDAFRTANADLIKVKTNEDYMKPLYEFFKSRNK